MIDIILTDLDSTLCHTKHREYLAPVDRNNTQNWIAYSQACVDDLPITGTLMALKLLQNTYPIFVVSGRNVEAYDETKAWLEGNGVFAQEIRLHKESDIRHNGSYKVDYIQQLKSQGYNPILMFEDHEEVAAMVEESGVPVVLVRPPYDDLVGVSVNNLVIEQIAK